VAYLLVDDNFVLVPASYRTSLEKEVATAAIEALNMCLKPRAVFCVTRGLVTDHRAAVELEALDSSGDLVPHGPGDTLPTERCDAFCILARTERHALVAVTPYRVEPRPDGRHGHVRRYRTSSDRVGSSGQRIRLSRIESDNRSPLTRTCLLVRLDGARVRVMPSLSTEFLTCLKVWPVDGAFRRRHAQQRLHTIALVCLSAVLAACGSSGLGSMPSSTATPVQPTPRPTTTSGSVPTPSPVPGIVAMPLATPVVDAHAFVRVDGVNTREWISAQFTAPSFVTDAILLPTDAGPDAGPLPVPGCPLIAPSPDCAVKASSFAIGETDWIYAVAPFPAEGGVTFHPAMIGPLGEIVGLFPPGQFVNFFGVKQPVVGPGSQLAWLLNEGSGSDLSKLRPIVWPRAGTDYGFLPNDGFETGPAPTAFDTGGGIAGAGIEPQLPVVWLPADADYSLIRLPLLPGGTRGGALGIDGDIVVGWSDDGSTEHAVVWVHGDDSFAVSVLPLPETAAACTRAVSTSASRIVGECLHADGAVLSVLWDIGDGADSWRIARILLPAPGDSVAHVTKISGDLAVGTSEGDSAAGGSATMQAVAWRLRASAD
jgi:hypothetical protein